MEQVSVDTEVGNFPGERLESGETVQTAPSVSPRMNKAAATSEVTTALTSTDASNVQLVDKLGDIQKILDHNSASPQTFVNSLPELVQRRVRALKKLQLDYFNLEAKFYQELHSLECKYEHLYTPILRRRCDIVGASVEPTDEECNWISDEEEIEGKAGGKVKGQQKQGTNTEDSTSVDVIADKVKEKLTLSPQSSDKGMTADEADLKGIPGFWLRIFQNVDILAEQVQKHDEPILKSLLDIRTVVDEAITPPRFRLEFIFEPNDYFSNAVLTKDYEMSFEPDKSLPLLYDGPDIVKCSGCTIAWKDGKNVTEKQVHKVQRHKTKGTKKTVVKTVKSESFFNFFNPPQVKEGEEPNEEIEDLLSADFEVGHFLRNQVIPRAVLYYTGDALLDSDDDYDSDDADDDDEVVINHVTSSDGGHHSGDGRRTTDNDDEDD